MGVRFTGGRKGQRGYILALLLALVTVMGLMLTKAMPSVVAEVQRDAEEELIFRGAALRLLQPLGKNAAIAGQAVLFAAMHGSWTAKAYALGMGLIFGWAADRAGSLLPGLVLHILNNGIMLADCLAERRIP